MRGLNISSRQVSASAKLRGHLTTITVSWLKMIIFPELPSKEAYDTLVVEVSTWRPVLLWSKLFEAETGKEVL